MSADKNTNEFVYICSTLSLLNSFEPQAIKNLLQTNRPIPAVALVDVFAPTVVVEQDDGQKKNNNSMAQEAKKRKSSSGLG